MRLRAEAATQINLPAMQVGEQLAADFKGMNLSTGPHPMTLVRERLAVQGVQTSQDLAKVANYKLVTVAGVVVIRQRPATAKGFLFITMEDETGFINVVVKPKMLEKYRKTLIFYGGLIVKGQLEKKDGVINVIGHQFEPLVIGEAAVKSRDFR
jgi:DNA polymerase III alpha subunit